MCLYNVLRPCSVCVGSCPDPDCIVTVECLATSAPRKVLHVQSISLWAPSCIGPYSQASTVNGLVHCAGQIPLEAGTMVLVPGEPAWAQTVRCVESCRCVLDVHRSALHQVVGGEYTAFDHRPPLHFARCCECSRERASEKKMAIAAAFVIVIVIVVARC